MTKIWKKITAVKLFYTFAGSKIAIYLSLGLHRGRNSYPSALKREHPGLQNMKILNFFLSWWVIFALLVPDPNPATQINADPCDPDPQPWF